MTTGIRWFVTLPTTFLVCRGWVWIGVTLTEVPSTGGWVSFYLDYELFCSEGRLGLSVRSVTADPGVTSLPDVAGDSVRGYMSSTNCHRV